MKSKFLCTVALSAILIFMSGYDTRTIHAYDASSANTSISKSAKVKAGWKKIDSNWYYINNDGKYKSGWLKDNGKWYYLSKHNYKMLSNRVEEVDGKNYYFNPDGSMSTHKGWKQVSYNYGVDTYTTWLYLNGDGTCKIGWFLDNGKWYYFDNYIDSGIKDIFMQTGMVEINKKLYYFKDNGSMSTNKGWEKYVDKYESEYNTWYYLNGDGTCKTGWVKDQGKWYYWNSYGDFYRDYTYKIDDKNYTFDTNGVCTNPY